MSKMIKNKYKKNTNKTLTKQQYIKIYNTELFKMNAQPIIDAYSLMTKNIEIGIYLLAMINK